MKPFNKLGSCGCVVKKVFIQVPSLNSGDKVLLEYLRKRQAYRPTPSGASSIVALEARLPSAREVVEMPDKNAKPPPESGTTHFQHVHRDREEEKTEEVESVPEPSGTESVDSATPSERDIEKVMNDFNDVTVNYYLEALKDEPNLNFVDYYTEEMDYYANLSDDKLKREHAKLSYRQVRRAREFMSRLETSDQDKVKETREARIRYFEENPEIVLAYTR